MTETKNIKALLIDELEALGAPMAEEEYGLLAVALEGTRMGVESVLSRPNALRIVVRLFADSDAALSSPRNISTTLYGLVLQRSSRCSSDADRYHG